jgi:hypothetical protein
MLGLYYLFSELEYYLLLKLKRTCLNGHHEAMIEYFRMKSVACAEAHVCYVMNYKAY